MLVWNFVDDYVNSKEGTQCVVSAIRRKYHSMRRQFHARSTKQVTKTYRMRDLALQLSLCLQIGCAKKTLKLMVLGNQGTLTAGGSPFLQESAVLRQKKDAKCSTDSQLSYLLSWGLSQPLTKFPCRTCNLLIHILWRSLFMKPASFTTTFSTIVAFSNTQEK